MLFDLFVKIWATPENIIELIFDIMTIVGMCFIFVTWKEKWWKSLIPFYGTYIIYKHTWENQKWVFLLPIVFNIVSARCMSFLRKHIIINVFDTIKTYIETEQLNVDINITQLMICIALFTVSALISFVLTRITYMKICNSLHIRNVLLKIGTFLFPPVFLLVDYIYHNNRQGD